MESAQSGLLPLLELDGYRCELGGGYWIKFDATLVTPSEARPAGIKYSLTIHAPSGNRLGGYDNAHAVKTGSGPGRQKGPPDDHLHRGRSTERYPYADAETLVRDFWCLVEEIMREEGIQS